MSHSLNTGTTGFVPSISLSSNFASSSPITTCRCPLTSTSSNFISTHPLPSNHAQNVSYLPQITMKKGRIPRPMMPQRPQQQKTPLPPDGTPVFALYVRTQRTKIWYPLGAVKGDDRSKNLVDALKGGFAKPIYQQALDRGMAQTLYGKENAKYVQGAIRLYPQLKKYTSELQFGYKVAAEGLDEQPTKVVTKEMAGSVFSNMQRGISNWFKNVTSGNKEDTSSQAKSANKKK